MNYEELKKKAKESRERRNASWRQSYQLARSLGFSSEEASVLQGRSEKAIRQLAKERDSQ